MIRGATIVVLLLASTCCRSADFELATRLPGSEFLYDKDFMKDILQAFMSPKGVNMTSLIEAFNPSDCLHRCMQPLSKLLESLSAPHRETKINEAMCKQLSSIDSCAAEAKCDSTLLDLAKKTYQFACMQNVDSIGSSLKCAQEAFGRSRADCESGCIVDRSIHQGEDKPILPAVNIENLCQSSVCLLGCMQKSINSACLSKNSSPSLFNAILTTTNPNNTLSSLLSGMIPAHCRTALKTKKNLPEHIAQLASIGHASAPYSVGQVGESSSASKTAVLQATPKATAAARSTTSTAATAVAAAEPTEQLHPLLWSPDPVEAQIDIDGEARTLQCRLLDYERRSVDTPAIDKLARIIAQQLIKNSEEIAMRSMDDERKSDWMFRRWAAAKDAESYRAIGFGAATKPDGAPTTVLRANVDSTSNLPSWSNVLLALLFPFFVFFLD